MNYITAPLMVKNKEVAEGGEEVDEKVKGGCGEKGLELSVTENGKERKSKMIASCGFLEDELRQCSKEEGVTMAEVKRLRVKEFQKSYMKVGVKKLLRTGIVPVRQWRAHAVGMDLAERLKLRRQMAGAAGKRRTTSLSIFMEAFEVEEELSTMATQAWADGVCLSKWCAEQNRSMDEADP